MITTNGKKWIAQYLGINNCFVPSGISWTYYAIDGNSLNESGGTAQLVARLVLSTTDRVVITSPVAGTFTYLDLKNANGGQDVTLTDSITIKEEDGDPVSETQYCYTPGEAPPPVPEQEVGTYEFINAPTGTPSVYLYLGNLIMAQDTKDYHFKMDNVAVSNTSPYPMYIAFRVKLFAGDIGACPTSGEVFDGLDRTATARNYRIQHLDPNEVAEFDLDFYQPLNISGIHTVCLYIHGAWIRTDLISEISGIVG
jgi:hypothetical protein